MPPGTSSVAAPARRHPEVHVSGGDAVRDLILGMSDGLTTPFALAAGLAGAASSNLLVVIGGLAEIAAGSISMGLGGYLAAKSLADTYHRELARETEETHTMPAEERAEGQPRLHGAVGLASFRLEMGLPVWRYELDGEVVEKRLHLPYLQNTVHVTYRRLAGRRPLRLRLRPELHFRPHERDVDDPERPLYQVTAGEHGIEVKDGRELPPGSCRRPSCSPTISCTTRTSAGRSVRHAGSHPIGRWRPWAPCRG